MAIDFAPLLASLYFYGIVFAICELGRRLGRAIATDSRQFVFVNEFFGTLQLCAMSYENGLIMRHYGFYGFFAAVFVSVIVHTMTMSGAYGNPCPVFEESARNRRGNNEELLIRLIAQVVGGLASFRLARLIWTMGFMADHSRLADNYPCSSDLHVPILYGLLYEAAASFAARLIFAKSGSLLINALAVPTIVLLGLTKTGMYFNPILAFSLNYGCKGTSPVEHFLVYWLGPTIGWMLGSEVDRRTKRD